MRRAINLLALGVMLALFAVPALAQSPVKECTDEAKSTLYQKWYDNRKDHQDVAYQAAKEYLTTCPADESDQARFLKKWVGLYEGAVKTSQLRSQLDYLYGKKNYAEAMNVGKQVLADDPNYIKAYILLGYIANFTADSNQAVAAESVNYAKKAVEMVESGKTPENWQAFSKDEALAWLNRSIGLANLKNAPPDAVPYLLKAARYESPLKKDPATYLFIEQAYENGPYAKQSDAYKPFIGKDETPESKLALENIYQVVDRMVDAYARAIALASNDPNKTEWTKSLTDWYKFRHNKSDAGLTELMASILSKPLPDVPIPLTALPTPAPTPTPATTGTQPTKPNGSTTGQPSKPGSNGAKTTPNSSSTAKPSTTNKPKPRSHHTRRA